MSRSGDDNAALTVRGLSVRRGGRVVVHDVDLTLAPGEIVAVLGPNGAGKSTLLAALSGTLDPAGGTVHKGGRVAALMQTPGLAARSAHANVELALAWWGVPRAQRGARTTAALRRMSADHLAARFAPSLSGGEQRRVHLARAVVVEPDVLLLDEPFDGLDPQTRTVLRDDTTQVLRDLGSAVLVVLHDRVDAWAMADRLLIMVNGRIAALGPPADLLRDPPTPDVARLLGYDGEFRTGGRRCLTRSAAVRLDPDGPFHGVVRRVTRTETGARLHLDVDEGALVCDDQDGLVRPGDAVRVAIERWVEFDDGTPFGDDDAGGVASSP